MTKALLQSGRGYFWQVSVARAMAAQEAGAAQRPLSVSHTLPGCFCGSQLAGNVGQEEARSPRKATSTSCPLQGRGCACSVPGMDTGVPGQRWHRHDSRAARGCSEQAPGGASAQMEATESPKAH